YTDLKHDAFCRHPIGQAAFATVFHHHQIAVQGIQLRVRAFVRPPQHPKFDRNSPATTDFRQALPGFEYGLLFALTPPCDDFLDSGVAPNSCVSIGAGGERSHVENANQMSIALLRQPACIIKYAVVGVSIIEKDGNTFPCAHVVLLSETNTMLAQKCFYS